MKGNYGDLEVGEFHPAAESAMKYVRSKIDENGAILLESFASNALAGNRLAEICHETMRRIIFYKPVSDRYLLGLAWTLKEMEVNK